MRLLILEDDKITATNVANVIKRRNPELLIDTAQNIDTAMQLLDNHKYSFFILDIMLSENRDVREGIIFAQYLRSSDIYRTAPILFTTSLPDEIERCLNDFHCYSYLLKPYNDARLLKAIDDLLASENDTSNSISIRLKSSITIKLSFGDIVYITSDGHELTFYCFNDSTYTTNAYTMKDILNILPSQFIRCHKCNIINKDYVTSYSKSSYCVNIGKTFIPIGRTYLKDLVARLEK